MLQFFVRREPKISFVKRKMPRLSYVCRVDGRHGQVPRAMHLHEERAEAVLILQGSGSYNIAEKQYTAQAGDVLFFNSGVLHDETAVEDRDIVTLCIAVQGLELHGCRRNALLPENIAPLVHLGEDFSSMERMFSLLVDSVACHEPAELLEYLTQALIVKLADCASRHGDPFVPIKEDLGLRIKDYIDAHYCEQLALPQMAGALGINAYYLAHAFKEKTGYAPMQYVTRRRIGEAQNWLINTEQSITDIAMHCGYNNSNYFQRVFHTVVGMSPGQYRKYWVREIEP